MVVLTGLPFRLNVVSTGFPLTGNKEQICAPAYGATTLGVTKPSDVANGDLVLFYIIERNFSTSVWNAGLPAGVVSVGLDDGTNSFTGVFAKIAGASEPATYVFTRSTSSSDDICIHAITIKDHNVSVIATDIVFQAGVSFPGSNIPGIADNGVDSSLAVKTIATEDVDLQDPPVSGTDFTRNYNNLFSTTNVSLKQAAITKTMESRGNDVEAAMGAATAFTNVSGTATYIPGVGAPTAPVSHPEHEFISSKIEVTTNLNIDVPVGTVNGDLLIFWMDITGNNRTPVASTGFNAFTRIDGGGPFYDFYVAARVASSEPVSYVWAWSGSSNTLINAGIHRITGHSVVTPGTDIDVSTLTSATAVDAIAPAVTATGTNNMVMRFVSGIFGPESYSASYPANHTGAYSLFRESVNIATGQISRIVAYEYQTASGAVPTASFPQDVSAAYRAMSIVIPN